MPFFCVLLWRMKLSKRIWAVIAAVSRMVMWNLPLLLLWCVALAAPAVGDLPKLWQLEYPTVRYVLGLLRIMTCSVGLAVTVATVVAIVARWKLLRWLLALVALAAIATYAFLMINYGTRLTPEIFYFIIETNRAEATEFLSAHLCHSNGMWLAVTIIVLLPLWIALDTWWHKRGHELSPGMCKVLTSVLIMAVTGAACAPSTWMMARSLVVGDKRQYNDSFGLDTMSNLMFCRIAMRHADELILEAIAVTRKAVSTPARRMPNAPTVVLVIGESYIKCHAAIYGYPLATTPWMSHEMRHGRLWAFADAVSPFNNTFKTMQSLLSLNSVGLGEQWHQRPLVAAIFKSAGYQVDLWDNQRDFFSETTHARGLNGFIYHPDVKKLCYTNLNSRNYSFDGEIVTDYSVSASSGVSGPRLVIFHLRGQHIMASKRYPHGAGFDRFTVKDYAFRKESFLTHEMLEEIAHYDNATLYNDHVMGEIFKLFCNQDAVVVFLSDHGEEIYDYRPSIGRIPLGSNNHEYHEMDELLHYQFDVPLVVWCSPIFIKHHPEKVKQIASATNRRFSTDDIGQMLLGIAGIGSASYCPATDVTNEKYVAPKRVVNYEFKYDK